MTESLQKDSTLSSGIPKKDVCLSVFSPLALLLLLVSFLWYSAHKRNSEVILLGYGEQFSPENFGGHVANGEG